MQVAHTTDIDDICLNLDLELADVKILFKEHSDQVDRFRNNLAQLMNIYSLFPTILAMWSMDMKHQGSEICDPPLERHTKHMPSRLQDVNKSIRNLSKILTWSSAEPRDRREELSLPPLVNVHASLTTPCANPSARIHLGMPGLADLLHRHRWIDRLWTRGRGWLQRG